MKIGFILLLSTVLVLICNAGDVTEYGGQQKREIKALSEAEVSGYLAGRGMGFAKAAELNGYPGPAHVLELADELGLTPEQKAKAQALKDSMKNAASLGARLVDAELQLDTLFAQGEATDEEITRLAEQISQLQAQIRPVHLRAHLQMRDVLTANQMSKYKQKRGYAAH